MGEFFNINKMLVMVIPLLLAITARAYAQGLMAERLGDPTPRQAERLTFNPIPHLDIFGTIMIFLIGFGWGKPMPIEPRNFKNPAKGTIQVALIGSLANFGLAFLIAILYNLAIQFQLLDLASTNVTKIIFFSIVLNFALGVFNLLPIPPLDGFQIISYFLPLRMVITIQRYQTASFIVLMVLAGTGILGMIIQPTVTFLLHLAL